MTPVVDNVGKQIFSLCWEKGLVDDVVRDQIVMLRLQVNSLKNCLTAIFEYVCSKLFTNIIFALFRLKQRKRINERPKQPLQPVRRSRRQLRRGTCQAPWHTSEFFVLRHFYLFSSQCFIQAASTQQLGIFRRDSQYFEEKHSQDIL